MATSSDRVLAAAAADLIEADLRRLVGGPAAVAVAPPEAARSWLEDLLARNDTYRDAALAILAFPVAAHRVLDTRLAPPSRRGVTQRITRVCNELSIPCRQDAFQTLAKGQKRLDGLDRVSFVNLVTWAAEASLPEVKAAYEYVVARIAQLARPLPAMPIIATRRLTFARVWGLLAALLGVPSKGAHEQLIFAALLSAVAEEDGRLRVDTKNINAADTAAGTAADVQLWRRGVLQEAYEISANDWRSKVDSAARIRLRSDLPRVHIVAAATNVDENEIEGELLALGFPPDTDISVLDVRQEIRSLVAKLTRQGRRTGLERLYELLRDKQPDDQLLIDYVGAVHAAGVSDGN